MNRKVISLTLAIRLTTLRNKCFKCRAIVDRFQHLTGNIIASSNLGLGIPGDYENSAAEVQNAVKKIETTAGLTGE